MSEAQPHDDDEAMLVRLAQLDLALAERVHAAAMAASEPDEINDLGRTYQRVARSLRQTLALKAKLRRDREAERRASPPPEPSAPKLDWVAMRRRQQAVGGAVHRVIADTFSPESADYDMHLDILGNLLDQTHDDPEFLTRPLDEHVLEACAMLDLPLETAERWRDLPPVPAADEDDLEDDDEDEDEDRAVEDSPAWRSSG